MERALYQISIIIITFVFSLFVMFGSSAIDGETRQDLEVSQRLGKEEVKRQKEEREKERLRKEHEHKEREEKRKREKEEKVTSL